MNLPLATAIANELSDSHWLIDHDGITVAEVATIIDKQLTAREAGCPHCRGEVGVIVCSVADVEKPKLQLIAMKAAFTELANQLESRALVVVAESSAYRNAAHSIRTHLAHLARQWETPKIPPSQ